jgi:ABC-type amino acid transport system permease subunit
MIANLLFGLPGERPGGLLLTITFFVTAGGGAFIAGFVYATICAGLRRQSLPLQICSTLVRGMPLLLLVFLVAHIPGLSASGAGFLALLFYSASHVGEILRPFVASYPESLSQQAGMMGIGYVREWIWLRMPWMLWRAHPVLLTHWVSLLKDTGALIVLGIAELTTIAKMLSELQRTSDQWAIVFVTAGGLYLGATFILIHVLQFILESVIPLIRCESESK